MTNPIIINDRALVTNDPTVTLTLTFEGATEMLVSQLEDFGDTNWQPFASPLEFLLTGGDGPKRVFVQFRDSNLVESEVFSSPIVLDTTAPAFGEIPIKINETVCLTIRDELRRHRTKSGDLILTKSYRRQAKYHSTKKAAGNLMLRQHRVCDGTYEGPGSL